MGEKTDKCRLGRCQSMCRLLNTAVSTASGADPGNSRRPNNTPIGSQFSTQYWACFVSHRPVLKLHVSYVSREMGITWSIGRRGRQRGEMTLCEHWSIQKSTYQEQSLLGGCWLCRCVCRVPLDAHSVLSVFQWPMAWWVPMCTTTHGHCHSFS